MIVPFTVDYLLNNWEFIKTSFPIGSLIWLELICFEIYSFYASNLNKA